VTAAGRTVGASEEGAVLEPVDPQRRIRRLRVPGAWGLPATCCWLVRADDGVTLVDVGLSAAAVLRHLPEIEAEMGRLRRIVLTHAHIDHAGGLRDLVEATGATPLASEAEVPYLTGRASTADAPGSLLCRAILRVGRLLGLCDPAPTRGVEALREGDRVGGMEVLATPGHTPGSLSLWDPQTRSLFTGDNVLYDGRRVHLGVSQFTLDVAARNRSCGRYREFDAAFLLAGHEETFGGDVRGSLAFSAPA